MGAVGTAASAAGRPASALRGRWAAPVLLVAMMIAGCGPVSRPGPAPIPDRAIDLDAHCRQTDEAGFREDARLKVRDNLVQQLDWKLWVGRRGQCAFDGSAFRQVKRRPHIELLANDGSGCKLMVWQDPGKVTLAHAGCQRACTPGIYEEAWPAMFDPRTGGCAADR